MSRITLQQAAESFCFSCLKSRMLWKSKESARITRCHYIQSRSKSYYEVLNISKNASRDEIRAAFVDLSKKHHPDKHPDNPMKPDRFIQINKAYSTLIKPRLRQDYDTSLKYHLYRQRMTRNMASSHSSATSSAQPDNWTENDGSTRFDEPFHDEYIFDMRDRSQDAKYAHKPYYGVKGVESRVSNSLIVYGCIGVIILGVCTHLLVIAGSEHHRMSKLDEKDRRLNAVYVATKRQARLHGNDAQMQLLSDKAALTYNNKDDSR